MLRKASIVFNGLLGRINGMPVIDCHEHLGEPSRHRQQVCQQIYEDPIRFLVTGYFISDIWSAGATDKEIEMLQSPEATTDEKWPVFQRLWGATEHTAYARVTKLILKDIFGVEELTRESLDRVSEQLSHHDRSYQSKLLRDAGIKALVTDVLYPMELSVRQLEHPDLTEFLEGRYRFPEGWHPAFPLPTFCGFRRREFVNHVGDIAHLNITSLAEYEEALFEILQESKAQGVVAIKDDSAYYRVIAYDLPTRSDAERIFNRLLVDPRNELAWPDVKPLDDYLFHQCMRYARELDLPVQLHTGHLARIRNRVQNANAAHLAPVLELHTQVRFDLFHGNWPYMGDLLFLGKNYPNVYLDLCWLPIIDPLYAKEFLKRAVMTVPHSKLHGFGGDYSCVAEHVTAHLKIARQVIAAALADLVESGWLEEEEAARLAADWLFNNPNKFFGLGLPPYGP